MNLGDTAVGRFKQDIVSIVAPSNRGWRQAMQRMPKHHLAIELVVEGDGV